MFKSDSVREGAYGRAQHFLMHRYHTHNLSLPYLTLAGGFAGFAQSFITCPVDVIKNRMQVQGIGHGESGGIGNIAMARQVSTTNPIISNRELVLRNFHQHSGT
jgi:hypothetical protein